MSVTVAVETAANNAVGTLKHMLIPFGAFSVDYAATPGMRGQVIQVPVVGAITGNQTENSYEQGSSSVSKVDVTLNKYQQAPLAYTDVEQQQLEDVAWLQPHIEEAMYQVGYNMMRDIMSEVTAANFTLDPVTCAAAAFDYDQVVDIRTQAAKDKFPMQPGMLSLLMTPDYHGALLKDTKISNNLGIGGTPLTQGQLPNVAGFVLRESGAIPDNSESLVGMAVAKSAIGIAIRPTVPGQASEGQVDFVTVTDPATGATFTIRIHYSAATGTTHINVECRYGYELVDGTRGIRIKSE